MALNGYYLEKEKYNNHEAVIDNHKLHGFQVTPKNKVKYDGIIVNQMTVIKPSFIEKVIKKKIKRRLDAYLQYIIHIMDHPEEDGSGTRIALNDLERYKNIIKNKYRIYLEEKYVELLLKKIALLERELKIKNYYYEQELQEQEEKSKGRSR